MYPYTHPHPHPLTYGYLLTCTHPHRHPLTCTHIRVPTHTHPPTPTHTYGYLPLCLGQLRGCLDPFMGCLDQLRGVSRSIKGVSRHTYHPPTIKEYLSSRKKYPGTMPSNNLGARPVETLTFDYPSIENFGPLLLLWKQV